MKFTVLWTAAAEARLAAVWLQAADRIAITAAARTIDVTLQNDPQRVGESRSAGR